MEIREYKTYNEPEILRLYASVGWTAYTDHPEVLRQGVENSMLTLAAYKNDQLLGIIRTVGDGQHGTARWATKQEIHHTYHLVRFDPQAWRRGKDLPKMQGIIAGSVGRNSAPLQFRIGKKKIRSCFQITPSVIGFEVLLSVFIPNHS